LLKHSTTIGKILSLLPNSEQKAVVESNNNLLKKALSMQEARVAFNKLGDSIEKRIEADNNGYALLSHFVRKLADVTSHDMAIVPKQHVNNEQAIAVQFSRALQEVTDEIEGIFKSHLGIAMNKLEAACASAKQTSGGNRDATGNPIPDFWFKGGGITATSTFDELHEVANSTLMMNHPNDYKTTANELSTLRDQVKGVCQIFERDSIFETTILPTGVNRIIAELWTTHCHALYFVAIGSVEAKRTIKGKIHGIDKVWNQHALEDEMPVALKDRKEKCKRTKS